MTMSLTSLDDFNLGRSFASYQPLSLVRCGIVVGDVPPIPNRVRALARVLQNADPFQFPDLHDPETGELRESAVIDILDELGVQLTDPEKRVFPLALRESKRTLWRAAVYGRPRAGGPDDGGDSSKVPQIAKVLEACTAIDTEAAFAGATLGAIPDGVLLAYTTFSKIASALEPSFATHRVLLALYEKALAPLQEMHRIIREHNMYQTRRQAAFTKEETEDIAVANEVVSYVIQHLVLVIDALQRSRGMVLRGSADRFASATALPPPADQGHHSPSGAARHHHGRHPKQQSNRNYYTSREHFSMAEMFDDIPIRNAWAECYGDETPAVLTSEAAPFLELLFPAWSRDMLLRFFDFFSHGILSVFGLHRILRVWGPSTLLPFKIANDIRRKSALMLGMTPKAVKRHITNLEGVSGSTAQSTELPSQGAYAIALTNNVGPHASLTVYVKTKCRTSSPTKSVITGSFRSRTLVRELELARSGGVWQIVGVTSPGGLGGFESISGAINAFDRLFLHPSGTVFDPEFFNLVSEVMSQAAAAAARVQLELNPSSAALLDRAADAGGKSQQGGGGGGGGGVSAAAAAVAGAAAESSASDTTSMLHRAAYCCDVALVDKLLRCGSDAVVNFPQPDEIISGGVDWTPLVFAACSPVTRTVDCIKMLTSHGADVSFADGYGNTALYYAILNGHSAACAHLLRCNPDLSATQTSVSPLLVALGAHWLHPEINDVHGLATLRVSAAVIEAILYNGARPEREDLLLVCDILRAKERGLDHYHADYNKKWDGEEEDEQDPEFSGVFDGEEEDQSQPQSLNATVSATTTAMMMEMTMTNSPKKQQQQSQPPLSESLSAAANSTAAFSASSSGSAATAKTKTGMDPASAARARKRATIAERKHEALEVAVAASAFSSATLEEHRAAVEAFQKRHAAHWRRHASMVTMGQRQRAAASIISHGEQMRSEPEGVAELFRARRIVQDFLFFLSCQPLKDVVVPEPSVPASPMSVSFHDDNNSVFCGSEHTPIDRNLSNQSSMASTPSRSANKSASQRSVAGAANRQSAFPALSREGSSLAATMNSDS